MAVNTAITFLQHMKIHYLIESEQQSAEREAVMDANLYRGLVDQLPESGIIRMPINQNRPPRDTEYTTHIIFNALFEEAFGVEDVRSKALFCATSPEIAEEYVLFDLAQVFPLKTAKIGFIAGWPDTATLLQQVASTVTDPIKKLFGSQLMQAFVKKTDFFRTENPMNCMQQYDEFIHDVITEIESTASLDRDSAIEIIKKGHEEALRMVQRFTVIPATQASSISGDVEVMVFDAEYCYVQRVE